MMGKGGRGDDWKDGRQVLWTIGEGSVRESKMVEEMEAVTDQRIIESKKIKDKKKKSLKFE